MIDVIDVMTKTTEFLTDAVMCERIKIEHGDDGANLLKVIGMVLDVRFQIDFNLVTSATEIQEIYNKYRNLPIDESKIEIRTLMDIATFIKSHVDSTYPAGRGPITPPSKNPTMVLDRYKSAYTSDLIPQLASTISMHSAVNLTYTCQDASVTDALSDTMWVELLNSNPWLVSMVLIRMIPARYIIELTQPSYYSKAVGPE